ncbi:MAG: type II secretion system secretin GspD [Gammaproteobacteria bacterium]|nr:type II secretion system protein GspD [Chromatiales bacterium]MCP4925891.1 type II secretion system secretin GspD [Gammaproteobacteria bacterium]MDP7419871.1 type II secretion system secretin GspD [Gammaproteobacteria bacterium]MDP7660283.1 type II secretion system secretin GspD [Gammaproteobacteria bacterium]HJP39185.1 type II secretion system secretin GspD [Gammaproteobacteria bacterium]
MTRLLNRLQMKPSGTISRNWTPLLVLIGLLCGLHAWAQDATITPNYKDADIRQVIEAVGEVTEKNFIIDPRVKAQVTMLSSVPMSADAFYETFLSILQVYGFVAIPAGDVIKILPDSNARQMAGNGLTDLGDDIVTQVINIHNVSAAQLVPILRPLIPQYGHLAAHPASNMLIISDRAANVTRMLNIIHRIDQAGDEDFDVIRLDNASATQIVRIVSSLNQGARSQAGAAAGNLPTVVADDRTNSVLISGEKTKRLRIRALITHLDTPLEEGGDTRVRYLRYADAEELATKLQTQYQKAANQQGGPAATGDITIWADTPTNALIITAPPKVMRSMELVIDKLDIRRLQVLLETIIVEVSAEKAADLGVTWAIGDPDLENAMGITQFDGLTGVTGLAQSVLGDTTDVAGLNNGVSFGLGRLSDSGLSFVAIVEALEADTNTNIMGTPILTTLDNEEAEITVGQEVPFVTGSFTNSGTASGSVNPFQTVERQQVGLTLKLTPQINEGNAVRLKIEQEVSSVSESTQAVDLITNNRKINTSVIVEDGGTLVLGGLIQEDIREKEQRVPLLGSIPLLGALFRSSQTQTIKTNLMFFIRPTILRDEQQTALETNQKYNYIRDLQLNQETMPKLLPDLSPSLPATPPVIDLRDLKPQETAEPPED